MRCAFVLLLMIAFAGCSGDEREDLSARERVAAAVWKRHLPRSIPSGTEQDDLSQIYRRIAIAYANGQIGVLRDCSSLLGDRVVEIDRLLYNSMVRVARDSIYQNFLLGREMKNVGDFPSSEDFAAYLALNIEMVRLLGSSEARRHEPQNAADWMEGILLRRLTEYRQKCLDLGMREYAMVAERFRDEWIADIESEDGLTRLKMRCLLPILRERCKMTGKSEEDAIKGVRSYALCVINAGYTPKWLNEEFPLSPNDGSDWK